VNSSLVKPVSQNHGDSSNAPAKFY